MESKPKNATPHILLTVVKIFISSIEISLSRADSIVLLNEVSISKNKQDWKPFDPTMPGKATIYT